MWEQQTGIRIDWTYWGALRMRLGMPSGPAALRGLTHLNVLLTSAAVKKSPQVLVEGRVSGTVLSSLCFQFRANAAINPHFLVWECFNSCCGYDIADALANKLAHRISVFVNVVV